MESLRYGNLISLNDQRRSSLYFDPPRPHDTQPAFADYSNRLNRNQQSPIFPLLHQPNREQWENPGLQPRSENFRVLQFQLTLSSNFGQGEMPTITINFLLR